MSAGFALDKTVEACAVAKQVNKVLGKVVLSME